MLQTSSDSPRNAARGRRKALRVAVAALAWLAGSAWASAAPPEPAPEYRVKAEFIERFTQFVDWAPQLFPSDDTVFVVCAVGEGPLRAELDRVVRGRLKGHPARMRHLTRDEAVDGCHLLYIAPTERDALSKIVSQTRGKPILSVGDTTGYAAQGVIVNMFLDESSRVRFEINADVARESGLKISAKLLSLARLVGTRR